MWGKSLYVSSSCSSFDRTHVVSLLLFDRLIDRFAIARSGASSIMGNRPDTYTASCALFCDLGRMLGFVARPDGYGSWLPPQATWGARVAGQGGPHGGPGGLAREGGGEFMRINFFEPTFP